MDATQVRMLGGLGRNPHAYTTSPMFMGLGQAEAGAEIEMMNGDVVSPPVIETQLKLFGAYGLAMGFTMSAVGAAVGAWYGWRKRGGGGAPALGYGLAGFFAPVPSTAFIWGKSDGKFR